MSSGSYEVYLALRAGILSGEYPPNSHLSAQAVAQKLNVSRTPAREGLLRLEAEGLVHVVPNQGAYVSSWSNRELMDIYTLRATLEPLAAAAAAANISAADLATLEALVARMEVALEGDAPDIVTLSECNDAYHRLIAEAADNKKLTSTIFSVMAMPIGSVVFKASSSARLQRLMGHYREIIVALRARDPEWAHAAMLCHVLSAKSFYKRLALDDPRAGD